MSVGEATVFRGAPVLANQSGERAPALIRDISPVLGKPAGVLASEEVAVALKHFVASGFDLAKAILKRVLTNMFGKA